MKEVAQLKASSIKTAQEAILALKIGNARFFSGVKRSSDFSASDRRAPILAQTPFAVVLGCSDSRLPSGAVDFFESEQELCLDDGELSEQIL